MSSIKGVRDFYDDTVQMWANDWYDNTTMFPFLKCVRELLFEQASVLDLGCNCGYETKRMKELGLLPIGLDFSQNSIEEAKKRNPNIKFVCDDMLNDLRYLGSFDGIVAIASIIHIPEEKLELCFYRLYDILNDNGYLFMVMRAEEGKLDASYKSINSQEYDREVYGYSRELLEEKMNGNFSFVDELQAHDKHWKYYVYKKNNR